MWPWRTTSTGSSVLSLGSSRDPSSSAARACAPGSNPACVLPENPASRHLRGKSGAVLALGQPLKTGKSCTTTTWSVHSEAIRKSDHRYVRYPLGDFAIPTAFDASALALSLGDYFP